MVKRFDDWSSGPFAISDRMPWLPRQSNLALLTTNDKFFQQILWGTLVGKRKWPFFPSPWIYGKMAFPSRKWYWLKELKQGIC